VFAEADSFDATALGYTRLRPVAPDSTQYLRADGVAARPVGIYYETDFLTTTLGAYNSPWNLGAIATGTTAATDLTASHPGVAQCKSAAGATSGIYASIGLILLAGYEQDELIFRMVASDSVVFRSGWLDNLTGASAPTDGVYLRIIDTLARGMTANNGTLDSTASTYRIVAGRWYRRNVRLNSDASRAYMTLKDSVGTLVWSDSVSTQIPTGAGRYASQGFHVYRTGTAVAALVDVDKQWLWIPRNLGRGD
jgi:hypothetical protein